MDIQKLFKHAGMDSSLEEPKFFEELKQDLENIIDLIAQLPHVEDDISLLGCRNTTKLEDLASDEPFNHLTQDVVMATREDILSNTQIIEKNMIKI